MLWFKKKSETTYGTYVDVTHNAMKYNRKVDSGKTCNKKTRYTQIRRNSQRTFIVYRYTVNGVEYQYANTVSSSMKEVEEFRSKGTFEVYYEANNPAMSTLNKKE